MSLRAGVYLYDVDMNSFSFFHSFLFNRIFPAFVLSLLANGFQHPDLPAMSNLHCLSWNIFLIPRSTFPQHLLLNNFTSFFPWFFILTSYLYFSFLSFRPNPPRPVTHPSWCSLEAKRRTTSREIKHSFWVTKLGEFIPKATERNNFFCREMIYFYLFILQSFLFSSLET